MAFFDYRIGAGHNVALADLRKVEDFAEISPRNRPRPPVSQPVNIFPVRTPTLEGAEHGDGFINHVWQWTGQTAAALKFIEDTFLTNGTVSSAKTTIYTRLHNRDTFKRYNCYVVLPVPGQDYRYDRGKISNLRLRFRNLVAL